LLAARLVPPGHPDPSVDIACSDDPPRIGSHFSVAVALDKAEGLELTEPDKCVEVRIAMISAPNSDPLRVEKQF